MTEYDPEKYYDDDEQDLEEPQDGRDSQPPEEGSSDDPEALDKHDPLRKHDPILVQTNTGSTIIGEAAEPTDDEALDEERIIDDVTELDDDLDEPR
ncbi:hypothetical protein [Enteractinococcus helveticum]|uniref:Uncharacterized protein n=1 Tax=Enteractinococcus helveticum TaxID=1837282 RepID=A0A1B7LYP6_9MICC|nr:hypothetical protein [Enteractinococcus helveticum]OAV60503.1 hypothetical protein A6F49_11100 [Enteractinococcus helveticum]